MQGEQKGILQIACCSTAAPSASLCVPGNRKHWQSFTLSLQWIAAVLNGNLWEKAMCAVTRYLRAWALQILLVLLSMQRSELHGMHSFMGFHCCLEYCCPAHTTHLRLTPPALIRP